MNLFNVPKMAERARYFREAKANGAVVKPLFLNFPVTYMCNAKCVMCNIWTIYKGEKKVNYKKELKFEEIESFFKDNRDFLSDVVNVGLTGGEAFLRTDLTDIVRTIRENLPQANVGIQTNGFLPEKILRELKKMLAFYPGLGLAVSMDGVSETHDIVRGTPKAFEKIVQTIRGAQALGIRHITCGMTITSKNYQEVLKVRDVVDELGCVFSCFMADTGDYFDNEGRSYSLNAQQLQAVIDQLSEFQYNYYMDTLRRMLQKEQKRTLPCYSGISSLVLDPYGDVRPCIIRGEVLGNVRDGKLEDILSRAQAKETRLAIKDCTACWTQCETSTSAVVDPADVLQWFVKTNNKWGFIKYMIEKSRVAKRVVK